MQPLSSSSSKLVYLSFLTSLATLHLQCMENQNTQKNLTPEVSANLKLGLNVNKEISAESEKNGTTKNEEIRKMRADIARHPDSVSIFQTAFLLATWIEENNYSIKNIMTVYESSSLPELNSSRSAFIFNVITDEHPEVALKELLLFLNSVKIAKIKHFGRGLKTLLLEGGWSAENVTKLLSSEKLGNIRPNWAMSILREHIQMNKKLFLALITNKKFLPPQSREQIDDLDKKHAAVKPNNPLVYKALRENNWEKMCESIHKIQNRGQLKKISEIDNTDNKQVEQLIQKYGQSIKIILQNSYAIGCRIAYHCQPFVTDPPKPYNDFLGEFYRDLPKNHIPAINYVMYELMPQ